MGQPAVDPTITAPAAPAPAPVVPTPAPAPAPAAPAFDPATLSPEARTWLEDQARAAKAAADAKARTESKANARNEVLAELTKLAGGDPNSPASTDAVAQRIAAAEGAAKAARVETAVGRAARAAGADETLVTAVLAHTGKLTGLDPSAADFDTAVKATVDAAIAANPSLKGASAVPPAGSGATAGGFAAGTGTAGQITEAQLNTMKPEEINKALREGKLTHLLQ